MSRRCGVSWPVRLVVVILVCGGGMLTGQAAPAQAAAPGRAGPSAVVPQLPPWFNFAAAQAFADSQWDCTTPSCAEHVQAGTRQPDYQCAEFVSRVLAAGGAIPLDSLAAASSYGSFSYRKGSYNLRVTMGGSGYGPALGDFLLATKNWVELTNVSASDIKAGDVIYIGGFDHVMFGVGPSTFDAHNNARHNATYSGAVDAIFRLKFNIGEGVVFANSHWDCTDAACASRVDGNCATVELEQKNKPDCSQPNYRWAEFVARTLAAMGAVPALRHDDDLQYFQAVRYLTQTYDLTSVSTGNNDLEHYLQAAGWTSVGASPGTRIAKGNVAFFAMEQDPGQSHAVFGVDAGHFDGHDRARHHDELGDWAHGHFRDIYQCTGTQCDAAAGR